MTARLARQASRSGGSFSYVNPVGGAGGEEEEKIDVAVVVSRAGGEAEI